MTVATDLQNVVADVSAAIAERRTFGRTELEKLRRNLTAAAREAGSLVREGERARDAVETLCAGIDAGTVNLAGLAHRVRAQVSA